MPGWKITSNNSLKYDKNILTEDRKTLFKNYGLKDLLIAKYQSLSDPNLIAIIEIYCMNTSLDALGVYTYEKQEIKYEHFKYKYSRSYNGAINFIKGNYYIKIIANNYHIHYYNELSHFTEIIYNNIEIFKNNIPAYTDVFKKFSKGNEILYYRNKKNPIKFLNEYFLQELNLLDEERKIYFIKKISTYEAVNAFNKMLKIKGKSLIIIEHGDLKIALTNEPEQKNILVSQYNQWIFGLMDAENVKKGKEIIILLSQELVKQ